MMLPGISVAVCHAYYTILKTKQQPATISKISIFDP